MGDENVVPVGRTLPPALAAASEGLSHLFNQRRQYLALLAV